MHGEVLWRKVFGTVDFYDVFCERANGVIRKNSNLGYDCETSGLNFRPMILLAVYICI